MLSLYNSLTRKVEPFEPMVKGEVKMFTCGPSIYQRPHIGNYRTFLFEDVLQRYLEYLGCTVIRALNVTDIEDKAIQEAEKRTMDVMELTGKCGRKFSEDLELLRIKPPTYQPRSSTSVDQAVRIIEELLEKGHAYWYKGNVYFDIVKFQDFGKLGHLDRSSWPRVKKRYHKDTYPGNYWNLGDFILWHGYTIGDTVYWDTAIGRGRPAWNVQDPAMAVQTLGSSIDIYCGGEDNLVRHHDYTIAVVESFSGKPMASYWLHAAHLLVDGKKMSKSKGNVIYPDDLQKSGYSLDTIRFFLIYGSYRKRLNFTYEKLRKTSKKFNQVREMIDVMQNAGEDATMSDHEVYVLMKQLKFDFEKHMDNDLDVKQSVDDLAHTLLRLTGLVRRNLVTCTDARRIVSVVTGIDTVLQVFGLSDH